MGKIAQAPIPTDDQAAAIKALQAYKAQNPVKFAAKKDALYAKYGLSADLKIEVADEVDSELEEMADLVTSKPKKVAKKVTKTKTNKDDTK